MNNTMVKITCYGKTEMMDREKYIQKGEDLLTKELRKRKIPTNTFFNEYLDKNNTSYKSLQR